MQKRTLGRSGLDVLKNLRGRHETVPVLMLTARGDAMFAAMAERPARMALDLASLDLI